MNDAKIGYSTVEQVIEDILKTLQKDYIEKVKTMELHDFCVKQHFDLGLFIRNKYFYQNPAQKILKGNICKSKEDLIFFDEDQFSRIILKTLYEQILQTK
jgi:hypothetical protein